jgi:hypothetical protein
MSRRALAACGLVLAAAAVPARAASYLFYVELQGVAGYSTAAKNVVYSSMNAMETMQKPSLGFDYVQRFSGASGDIAILAVQGRLAYDPDGDPKVEPQLYNAYVKFKTRALDIWVGHNRPKFGLSASLDNHAALLQPMAMSGFGFDRDWGLGFERDSADGSLGLSVTTGSGMPLRLNKSYLISGRLTKGVLERDNSVIGLSAALGRILDVIGYHLMSEKPVSFAMGGVDFTWLTNSWENRIELLGGSRDNASTFALFWRTGIGLLPENRLKLEAQPVAIVSKGKTRVQFAAGATYLAGADWTFRVMYAYDQDMKDSRFIVQVYYYKGIRF